MLSPKFELPISLGVFVVGWYLIWIDYFPTFGLNFIMGCIMAIAIISVWASASELIRTSHFTP